MDWRSVLFDRNRARSFLVTAEEGSLSAAARALGMAQPTLGRQVAALEDELGVVLFERVGRGLALTPNGVDLLEHVRAMADAAGRVSLTASGRAQTIEGHICLTASEAISAYLLPPVLARLRREHPGIEVEIVASNATRDLRRREADIAVRSFRPTQPNLVAKKVKDVNAHLYGAPAYLDALGPLTSERAADVQIVGFDHTDQLRQRLSAAGLQVTAKNFPIITENHLVQWEMVKQGVCLGVMQEDIGDAEPAVRRALPESNLLELSMWIVAHREVNTSRRVRVVFDLLAEALGAKV